VLIHDGKAGICAIHPATHTCADREE